jgi:hypothetical protein
MIMKPGKTFNLSKQSKRFMATIVNAEERNAFKRAMIQAQLSSEVVVKSAPRDRNAPRGNANYQTNDTGTASTAQ